MKKIYILLTIFVVGALLGFFSTQTSIKTTSTHSDGKNVDLMQKTGVSLDTTKNTVEYFPGVTGYIVRPTATGTYPGIVMIHENRGLRPEIKSAAEALAQEGIYRLGC